MQGHPCAVEVPPLDGNPVAVQEAAKRGFFVLPRRRRVRQSCDLGPCEELELGEEAAAWVAKPALQPHVEGIWVRVWHLTVHGQGLPQVLPHVDRIGAVQVMQDVLELFLGKNLQHLANSG